MIRKSSHCLLIPEHVHSKGFSGGRSSKRLTNTVCTRPLPRTQTPGNRLDSTKRSRKHGRTWSSIHTGTSGLRSRDTAFVSVAAPVFEINNLFRPDEHTLGSLLGTGHASGKFVPDPRRQFPGSTKPLYPLKHGQPSSRTPQATTTFPLSHYFPFFLPWPLTPQPSLV